MNAKGFNVTGHMKGSHTFGKIQKVHLELFRKEIIHRSREADQKMKIRMMGKYLQSLEIQQQRKTYREQTGNNARDKDLNWDSFKPHLGMAAFNALVKKE